MTTSRAPMRILHVFRAPLGGLFRAAVDLAHGQADRGHEVGIFCDASTGNAVTESMFATLEGKLALGLHRVPISRNPGLGDIGAIRSLSRVYAQTRPDVLHGHGAKGGAYSRLLPLPPGTRIARVYTPHGGSLHYRQGSPTHRVYMLLERLMAMRTEVFAFECAYIARLYETSVCAVGDRARVVYNGLAAADFEAVDTSRADHDLLYVGELRAVKGFDVLLDAMALLKGRGRRLTLLAIGGGPEEPSLRARAERLGVTDQVTFAGPKPIMEALGRARLMVVPSTKESFPYVVLEAVASRQPLVATDVGGIPEVFGGLAHRLIPSGDAEKLAARIVEGLEEPEAERAAIAERLARSAEERFSIDAMVEGVLAGYAAGLGERPITTREPTLVRAD